MKKAIMIALALLISVAFITTVFAQAKPEAKPAAEKPMKAKTMKATGEFVSMDATAKTIVVKGDKGEMTFDVSAVKKMAGFKAGDKVRVSYTEKDDKMVAKSVKAAKAKK